MAILRPSSIPSQIVVQSPLRQAQCLGLEAHASDLNPVAVLINKALIEISPKFAGQPPINPEARKSLIDGDQLR
jgi:adenine-specific DNA methylase